MIFNLHKQTEGKIVECLFCPLRYNAAVLHSTQKNITFEMDPPSVIRWFKNIARVFPGNIDSVPAAEETTVIKLLLLLNRLTLNA